MKIRMLTTAPGSVDGFRVTTYVIGQAYDLTASAGARELAAAFVDASLAQEVGAEEAIEHSESAKGESSEAQTVAAPSEAQPVAQAAPPADDQPEEASTGPAVDPARKAGRGSRAKQ